MSLPGAILIVSALTLLFLTLGFHKVEEGHVGVYFRGGALLDDTGSPGYHWVTPFLTQVYNVQVTVQTDKVTEIPCGTSGGVMIHFDKVEVVNRLKVDYVHETIKNYTVHYDKTWVFDKIHHEINQFCSKNTLQEVYIQKFDSLDESLVNALQRDCNLWAPGIEIIAIRVTKPRIPDHILKNYEATEAELAKLQIAKQAQKVAETQAETKRKEEAIKAKAEAEVSEINMERKLKEAEAQKQIEELQNSIFLQNEKVKADAKYYHILKELEANERRLTPQYLELMRIMAIGNNTKIYFGDSIPAMFIQNSDVALSATSVSEKKK